MEFKIAMVQALTHLGPDEEEINIARAEAYIDEAADKGARLVCFPESFPGPWRDDNIYSPLEKMKAKAAQRKIYLICGDLEPVGDDENGFYNIFWLIGPDGEVVGKYRRTTPLGPWIYKGGKYWDFNYKTGDELPVFDIGDVKIGILMCSESYCTELGRALALQGAEIIFYPAGVTRKAMWETWSTLIKARAFENNAFTAVSKNMFGDAGDGFCIVAGPEGTLYESQEPGVHIVTLDLARMRWLRSTTEDGFHEILPYNAKPGALTQFRRPELFEKILASKK
ncbi:MAG: carbon-nitrogen hydrolase family protein [Clostridiales bacterium]|nr:carbon-nitrogen hydrolase family protein [Clostridiales bacterium]